MQCTSKYPTDPKDIGLNMIEEFKNRYNIEVGLSDHSGVIYPSLAAVSLGAKILEFHVVFDKNMFGPDSSSSLTMSEITQLVKGVRFIEESLKNKIDKSNADTFKSLKGIFEKSLAVNKNMKRGDMISFDDLEAKKPSGRGISAKMFSDIVGSELKNDISKWSFLTEEDINE